MRRSLTSDSIHAIIPRPLICIKPRYPPISHISHYTYFQSSQTEALSECVCAAQVQQEKHSDKWRSGAGNAANMARWWRPEFGFAKIHNAITGSGFEAVLACTIVYLPIPPVCYRLMLSERSGSCQSNHEIFLNLHFSSFALVRRLVKLVSSTIYNVLPDMCLSFYRFNNFRVPKDLVLVCYRITYSSITEPSSKTHNPSRSLETCHNRELTAPTLL